MSAFNVSLLTHSSFPAHLPQFSVSGTGPREPEFFGDDYQEAIRPVELHLDVLDPQASAPSSRHTEPSEPAPPHSSRYPPIFFKGLARGAHSADAVVEGSVRVLADGSIRWSFVSPNGPAAVRAPFRSC